MHPPQNKILNSKISVDLNSPIGTGSTGDVFKGIALGDQPYPIAVKMIPLSEINNEVTGYLLQCELQALKTISEVENSQIVKLEDIVVVNENCNIGMQLLEGGTLKQFIKKSGKIDEEKAIYILLHLIQGLKILKDFGIVHRDLKPENIMFKEDPFKNFSYPKIIDFGYCEIQSVKKKPSMFYNVGSPRYMSPEAYQDNIYSQKSDIWGIGVTFYQMVTGTTFDKGKNIMETFKMLKQRGIPIPHTLGEKTKKLIQGMLLFSPQKRLSCEQVLDQIYRQSITPVTLQGRAEMNSLQKHEKNLNASAPLVIRTAPQNRKQQPHSQKRQHENKFNKMLFSVRDFQTPNKKNNMVLLKNQIPSFNLINPSNSQKNLNVKNPQQVKYNQVQQSEECIYQQNPVETQNVIQVRKTTVSHVLPKNPPIPINKIERIITNPNMTQNQIFNQKINLGKNQTVRPQNQLSCIMPKKIDIDKRDLVHHKEIHKQKPNVFLANNGNNFLFQINSNKIVHKTITTHLQM